MQTLLLNPIAEQCQLHLTVCMPIKFDLLHVTVESFEGKKPPCVRRTVQLDYEIVMQSDVIIDYQVDLESNGSMAE